MSIYYTNVMIITQVYNCIDYIRVSGMRHVYITSAKQVFILEFRCRERLYVMTYNPLRSHQIHP